MLSESRVGIILTPGNYLVTEFPHLQVPVRHWPFCEDSRAVFIVCLRVLHVKRC